MTFDGMESKSYLSKNEEEFVKFRKSKGLKSNYSQYVNREIVPIRSPIHDNSKSFMKKRNTRYFDNAFNQADENPPDIIPLISPHKKPKLQMETKIIPPIIQKAPMEGIEMRVSPKQNAFTCSNKRGYQDIVVKPYKDVTFMQSKPNKITPVVFSNT